MFLDFHLIFPKQVTVNYLRSPWMAKQDVWRCCKAEKLHCTLLLNMYVCVERIKSTEITNWFEKMLVELVLPLQMKANVFSLASTVKFMMMLQSVSSVLHSSSSS